MSIVRLQGNEERIKGIYYEFDSESEPLGEGGMGRVYLGRRVDANGEVSQVAIKAMYDSLPNMVIERARREASIKVLNESLILMHAFIETAEKDILGGSITRYYVVSEFLDGICLTDFIRGRIKQKDGAQHTKIAELYNSYKENPEYQSTEIVKKVLSGVMALHDIGFVHRDIDPSNIMITSEGKVKLIDFGVAKQIVSLNTADRGLTSNGQFIGKAEYAAPELIMGAVAEQNFSTDVYAIGILYFQLLTGRLPFAGNSYDVMQAQLHKSMPLKHVKSKQIRNVIGRATKKGQSSRYTTAAQFRAAIDEFVFPEPWYNNYYLKPIGAAFLLALCLALCLAFFRDARIHAGEPQAAAEECYQKYFNELNSTEPATVQAGFKGMLGLAEDGYLPAMYEVAYTYSWSPKDSLLAMRKKNLGFDTDTLGLMIDNSKNEDALMWMKRIINLTDSANYQCMAWVSQYYLNGKVVNKDLKLGISLLEKSKAEAARQQDMNYVEKIEKTLKRLHEKYKNDNY